MADGETVSERRVARIMKENKVSPRPNKRRRPVTTDSNHNMSPSANLLEQDFHCLTPNAVWLVDITCIDTDEGWQCDPPNRTVLIRPVISGAPPTPSPERGCGAPPGLNGPACQQRVGCHRVPLPLFGNHGSFPAGGLVGVIRRT